MAFGSGGFYAERARDAQDYEATRGRRIHDVELVCSPDRVIRADELLIQHPLVVQQLARRYVDHLVIVAAPEMMEDRHVEQHFPDRMVTSENPQFFPDLLASATGRHLIRAIHARLHGFGVGGGEFQPFVGDSSEPGIVDSEQVRDVLKSAGLHVIRFSDATRSHWEGEGQFWHVLDDRIVQRPGATAHFALDFSSYPSAEASEAAIELNRQWLLIDADARSVVQQAVGLCRREGDRITVPFRDGEVVAYPNAGGGISWDVDDRQGVLARGLQRLPCDARPAISDGRELQALAARWEQLTDVASEVSDPARARDLLTASAWHLQAIKVWGAETGTIDMNAELLGNLNASILAGIDRTVAAGDLSAERAGQLREWINTDEMGPGLGAEEQRALAVITDRHDEIRAAMAATRDDQAWVNGFDAAGWPKVEEHTIAHTLSDFLAALFDIHEAHTRTAPAEQEAPVQERGRGR
jgi:hypothetical protein